MSYKDNYKSIQLNLLREKHADIIKWLEERSELEERSFNSLIIHLIKEAYADVKNKSEEK